MNFSDIQAGNVAPESVNAIRRTGVAVIRGVVSKDVAEGYLSDMRHYVAAHPFKGYPSDAEKKVCTNQLRPLYLPWFSFRMKDFHIDNEQVIYESYWSPSQVKARSHPNMLATQSWMNQLYSADADQKGKRSTDRKAHFTADIFLVDLTVPLSYCDRVQIRPPGDQTFALPPHVDGGGVERWEDCAYNHVYRKIFQGKVGSHSLSRFISIAI